MTLPPDLTFAELALELDDAGGLHYDWRVIEPRIELTSLRNYSFAEVAAPIFKLDAQGFAVQDFGRRSRTRLILDVCEVPV